MTVRNSSTNPYVGPRAFETGETLFGRDHEINELINLLIAERIVLLYSPSGAGKTSLIRAGLIPRLAEEGFHTLPVVRVNLEPPQAVDGIHFNRYIYSTLISLEEGLPEDQQTPIEELANISLGEYLSRRPKPEQKPDEDFGPLSEVIIFDQFEELITTSQADLESKEEFFVQLGLALMDKNLWALISMREDYIAALDPYLREVQDRLSVRFRLALLQAEEARQAIQRPARLAGVEFTDSAAQILVDDLRSVQSQLPDGSLVELAGPYIEPVQLQVVCYRLWQHLEAGDTLINEDKLEAVGNVDQSLADYYDESIAAISSLSGETEASIRFWFEHQLITEHNIRSQVLMEQHSSRGLANQAINMLEDMHLVRRDTRRGVTWFELAHDRLINPVRESNAAWFKAHQSPFQQQAALWQEQGQPESLLLVGNDLARAEQWVADQKGKLQPLEKKFLESCREAEALHTKRRLRRTRQITALLSFLTLISCICGITSLILFQVADTQRSVAEAARSDAEQQKVTAEIARNDAENQKQIALVEKQNAEEAQLEAELQRQAAEEARQDAEQQRQYRFLESQALNLVETQPDLALLLGLEAYRLDRSPELRGVLLDGIVKNARLTRYMPYHQNSVMAIAFRPDGEVLATGSQDGSVVLWERNANLPLLQPLLQDSTNEVYSLAFSPDGELLAAGTQNGSIYLWDVADPLSQPTLLTTLSGHTVGVFSLSFKPDGTSLASASNDEKGIVWDISAREIITEIVTPAYTLAYSPDGRYLALGNDVGRVSLLDANTLELVFRHREHDNDRIYSLEFSPDSKILASASADKSVVLWDVENQEEITSLMGHQSSVFKLAFSPDGQRLASGGEDHSVLIWDVDRRQLIHTLQGHSGPVVSLAFDPLRPSRLMSGSWDDRLIDWDLDIEQPLVNDLVSNALPKITHEAWISSVAVRPIDPILASSDADGNIFFWDLEDLLPIGEPITLTNMARELEYSPDGRLLAAVGCGERDEQNNCIAGGLRLWDASSREPIGESLNAHQTWISSLAFHPDGNLLATGSWDNSAILWDISDPSSPQMLSTVSEHSNRVTSIDFSPTADILATGSWDGDIILWDISNPGSPVMIDRIEASWREVMCLAFSPDGKILASGSSVAEVTLWDVATHQQIGSDLLGHRSDIRSLVFSPDGSTLASVSDDHTLILWDTATRARIGQPLPGYGLEIYDVAFSPDNQTLVSGGESGSLFLWNINDSQISQIACNIASRNLTWDEREQYHIQSNGEGTCPDVLVREKLIAANSHVLAGEHYQAEVIFEEIVRISTQIDDPVVNNRVCWFGSLVGFAEIVLPACEHAVSLKGFRSQILDSRGLARAITGDFEGAIEDFTAFVTTYEDNDYYAHLVEKRQIWIDELKAGRNPFDEETLRSLLLE